ncbi:GDSL-type esterase/lipase family protein [Mucilaginibacter sp.]|uniref:GDSL-type esterase/lipase family protein n=1 Tax=Mucilaginibacter sp. TaxID=1882438 RepID=UPI0025ED24BD|nr:GDSL-type esterase/lipase family protein [Mucilaginibacter sp.]
MKSYYKLALATSITLNILFVSFFIGKRFYYSHQDYIKTLTTPTNDSIITYSINKYKNNEAQLRLFKILPHSKDDIVFVGTSLTQGFPLQEFFTNTHLKNRGIGGNTVTDIQARIGEVIAGKPHKIFLEMGTNDIGTGVAIDTVYKKLIALIRAIKSGTPATKLYVHAVLPFAKNYTQKVKAYNAKVAGFCKMNNIPNPF